MDLKIKNKLETLKKSATGNQNEYELTEYGINIYDLEKEVDLVRDSVIIGKGKVKKLEIEKDQTKVIFEIVKLNGVS